MATFFQQILTLLIEPPGNLTYHIVLSFAVAGTLQAAINLWGSSGFPQGRRIVMGLSLLLFGRLIMFVIAGIAWQGLVNGHLLLPPIDRAITLISLIVIIWLWVFPEPLRMADAGTLLLMLLAVTVAAFSQVWWANQAANTTFNGSLADRIVEYSVLILALSGGALLIVRRPNGWGIGLAMLGVILAGHLIYLLYPNPGGDFSGAVRLAQMIAYPLLLALPQRFTVTSRESIDVPEKQQHFRPLPELLSSFFELAAETHPEKLSRLITQTISHAFVSDVCLLVSIPDGEQRFSVQCGYDLIREEEIEGRQFGVEEMPVIAASLRNGQPLRLPASSTSPDLNRLSEALKLEGIGDLLAVSIRGEEGEKLAGMILYAPYSRRTWTTEDQNRLMMAAKPLAQLLQRSRVVAALQGEIVDGAEELKASRSEIEQYRQEISRLRQELGESSQRVETQEPNREKLQFALEENARLKTSLSGIDQNNLDRKVSITDLPLPNEQKAVIVSIAQELRQPMSSIIGYTDFLLGESVGILGTLQRKFLERVKASSERMSKLLDDLIQITNVGLEQLAGVDSAVELGQLIDDAISQISHLLLSKKITLRVEVAENLPRIPLDPEAFQQIMIDLLENAGEVTPPSKEILLRARVEGDDGPLDYVLVQVVDQGGGIPPEDVPRIFSYLSDAKQRQITGVGKKSVNLPVVKAMVESLGGRIWVDTDPGVGSIFSLLLPVMPQKHTSEGGIIAK